MTCRAIADVDLFHIVDDPSNTPINKITQKMFSITYLHILSFHRHSESLTNTDTTINTTSSNNRSKSNCCSFIIINRCIDVKLKLLLQSTE